MKYTVEAITAAVAESESVGGVLRKLGARPAGGTHTYMTKRIKKLGLDTSHFTGQHFNRGKQPSNRKSPEEILILLPDGSPRSKVTQLRRALLEIGVSYICVLCGNTGEHMGVPLTLEVDHINGKYYDNRKENLRFLCPNCHSQCETNRPHKHRIEN